MAGFIFSNTVFPNTGKPDSASLSTPKVFLSSNKFAKNGDRVCIINECAAKFRVNDPFPTRTSKSGDLPVSNNFAKSRDRTGRYRDNVVMLDRYRWMAGLETDAMRC